MTDKAMLNYWSRFKSKDELVGVGDEVVAIIDEFDLTKDKKYKISRVHFIDEICVVNDVGIEEVYTVEHFRMP